MQGYDVLISHFLTICHIEICQNVKCYDTQQFLYQRTDKPLKKSTYYKIDSKTTKIFKIDAILSFSFLFPLNFEWSLTMSSNIYFTDKKSAKNKKYWGRCILNSKINSKQFHNFLILLLLHILLIVARNFFYCWNWIEDNNFNFEIT